MRSGFWLKEAAMNRQKLIQWLISTGLILLLVVGCSAPAAAPTQPIATPTPLPPTATHIPPTPTPEPSLCPPKPGSGVGLYAGTKDFPIPEVFGTVATLVKEGPPIELKDEKIEVRLVKAYYAGYVVSEKYVQPAEGGVQELHIAGKKVALVSNDISTGCIDTKEYGAMPILFSSSLTSESVILIMTSGQLEKLNKP
jgi:hypothetical protein